MAAGWVAVGWVAGAGSAEAEAVGTATGEAAVAVKETVVAEEGEMVKGAAAGFRTG